MAFIPSHSNTEFPCYYCMFRCSWNVESMYFKIKFVVELYLQCSMVFYSINLTGFEY